MLRKINELLLEEIEVIRATGALTPERVVDFARNPNTALHDRFTWDDTEAAQRWRLREARDVITVHFKMLPAGDGSDVLQRAYVSMTKADPQPGPRQEYRVTSDVLDDPDLRQRFIEAQLDRIEAMYKSNPLIELKPIAQAISKVRRSL